MYNAHQKLDAPLPDENSYLEKFGGKTYSATKLMEACVDFIKTNPKDQPFFLYYAPTLPHVALQTPTEWVNKFPKDWDAKPYLGANGYLPNFRPRATYAAMIAYLDHTVGEILSAVDAAGTSQNTLIIFTSDNGAVDKVGGADREFFKSNGPLRAGKMSIYEGGIRVPFVARWPGKIKPGSASSHTLVCYDAMATLCEAIGVRAPKGDGMSYLPALLGQKQRARSHVYFEYPEASAMQAVIFGKYKAVRPMLNKDPNLIEVYDLEADSSEADNLAPSRPDLVRQGLEIMIREHTANKDFPLGLVDTTK